MNEILLLLFSLSVSGSILALFLLAIRPLIKSRLSQTWQYYIWLVVILRFVLPFTPQFSMMGELSRQIQNNINPPAIAEAQPRFETDEQAIAPEQTPEVPATPQVPAAQNTETQTTAQPVSWREIRNNIWLLWFCVALVLFVYKAVSYRSFVRFIKVGVEKITDTHMLDIYKAELAAAKIKRRLPLYRNNQVVSPMLVGILRPALVIPALNASDDELRNILRHELTHYKRLDYLYKWLVQITLCLHWFNPLVHFVVKQINKSCELSCDEAVIRRLDKESRVSYGDALLLSLTAQGNYSDFVVSMTMSENGNIVKERLDMIMNFKKKSRLAVCVTLLLTVALLCGFTFTGAYAARDNTAIENKSLTTNASGQEVFHMTDGFVIAGTFHTSEQFTLEYDTSVLISVDMTMKTGSMSLALQRISDNNEYSNNLLVDKNGKPMDILYTVSGAGTVKDSKNIFLKAGTYYVSLTGKDTVRNASWKIIGTVAKPEKQKQSNFSTKPYFENYSVRPEHSIAARSRENEWAVVDTATGSTVEEILNNKLKFVEDTWREKQKPFIVVDGISEEGITDTESLKYLYDHSSIYRDLITVSDTLYIVPESSLGMLANAEHNRVYERYAFYLENPAELSLSASYELDVGKMSVTVVSPSGEIVYQNDMTDKFDKTVAVQLEQGIGSVILAYDTEAQECKGKINIMGSIQKLNDRVPAGTKENPATYDMTDPELKGTTVNPEDGKSITNLTIDANSANIIVRLSDDENFHYSYDSESFAVKTTGSGNEKNIAITATTKGELNTNYPSFVNIQIPNNAYQQITYLGDSAGMNLPSINANTKISVKSGSFAIIVPAGFNKICDLSLDTNSGGVLTFIEDATNYTFSLKSKTANPVLPSDWEAYRYGQAYSHKEGNGAGKINATVNNSSFVVSKVNPATYDINNPFVKIDLEEIMSRDFLKYKPHGYNTDQDAVNDNDER